MKFTNCLVIVNPAATHATRALKLVDELKNHFSKDQITIAETFQQGGKANTDAIVKLSKGLSDKSLVCIAGGDGTISTVINTLLRSPGISASARQATILPLWGGNANDLAYMANGLVSSTNLSKILAAGKQATIYPLRVKLQNTESSDTRLAVCYAGLGASAYAAQLMGRTRKHHKDHSHSFDTRLPHEMSLVVRAFIGSRRFRVTINHTSKNIYDLMIINGSRIAKVNYVPIKITDKAFYEVIVYHKHPLFIPHGLLILKGVTLKPPGKTNLSLVLEQSTWAQFDGEVINIPGQTKVSIDYNDQPFHILSTQL